VNGAAAAGEASPAGGIVIAPGARAAEDWLIAQLRALCEAARRNPQQLAAPVREIGRAHV